MIHIYQDQIIRKNLVPDPMDNVDQMWVGLCYTGLDFSLLTRGLSNSA